GGPPHRIRVLALASTACLPLRGLWTSLGNRSLRSTPPALRKKLEVLYIKVGVPVNADDRFRRSEAARSTGRRRERTQRLWRLRLALGQLEATTGRESRVAPLWAVKRTVALGLRQKPLLIWIRPRLPPNSSRWKELTGASGTASKVLRRAPWT